MAAQTCVRSQHATLSGTTADSIAFSGRGRTLRVTNRSGTAPLYFRTDLDTAGDPVTAVAAADETFVVPEGGSVSVRVYGHAGGNRDLKMSIVGDGNAYSVELW